MFELSWILGATRQMTQKLVKTDLPRTVVGFDFRDCNIIVRRSKNVAQSKRLFSYAGDTPACFDPTTWPSMLGNLGYPWLRMLHVKRFEDALNGLNLLQDIPETSKDLSTKFRDGCWVAFDLPQKTAKELSPTFGTQWSAKFPNPQALVAAGWDFMGFDVVDPRTQCSGPFSFEWEQAECAEIVGDEDIEINNYGLIVDLDMALELSRIFDRTIREHAPFCPCGVWSLHRSRDQE